MGNLKQYCQYTFLINILMCFNQCAFEKQNDSNFQKPVHHIISEESDIMQKRIMLMKWHDMVAYWDTKCTYAECHEDDSANVYRKRGYAGLLKDTIDVWGNYDPFVYFIDSTFEDDIIILGQLKNNKKECTCYQIFFPSDGMKSGGLHSSYYYKKDSKSIIPYKVGGSGYSYLIDERGMYFSNNTIIREKLFIEFLKTQNDSIKKEYNWVVKYSGFKSLFGDEGNLNPCNIDVVLKTEQKIESIQLKQVHAFFSDMKQECNTNIEYSEYCNKVLFLLLEKQTEIVIYTLEAKSLFDMSYILFQISNPILDYNLKELQVKIERSRGSDEIKKLLIDALKEADKGKV